MKKIIVKSKKLKEVINVTSKIENLLAKFPAEDGMLHLYLRHSTAALSTVCLAENPDLDLIGEFEIMLPQSGAKFSHEHTHRKDHLPAHVIASLLGPHLAIPVLDNKLMLGKYQSVAMIELNGPRKREILVDYSRKQG